MRRDGGGRVRRRRGAAFAPALQPDCDASGLRRGGTGTCVAGPRSAAAAPGPRGVGGGGLGPGPHRRRCVYGGTGADRSIIGGCGFREEPGLCLGQARRGDASSRRSFIGTAARARPAGIPISRSARVGRPHAAGRCRRLSADTGSWGRPWTMRRGRHSTRRRRCWDCPTPAAQHSRNSRRPGVSGRFVFPRPMLDRPGLDFSFSGLKTAALVALRGRGLDDATRADVARGFQEAVIETLAEKSRRALLATGHRRLVVAGGVGANRRLRERLNEIAHQAGARLYFPRAEFCTDNGAMIALAGCLRLMGGARQGPRFGCAGALGTRRVGSTGVLSISNG